jgi:hypothetical protein
VVREPSVDIVAPLIAGTRRRWPSRRLAAGLSPTPRPGLVLILVGVALGPHGLNVISAPALASLDPAVSVALAALGVLVGLGVDTWRPRDIRRLAAAGLESVATIALVCGGLLLARGPSFVREQIPWLVALMAGLCAASSSAPAEAADADGGRTFPILIAELDDVLPILVGVLAVLWTRPGPPLAVAWFVVRAALIAGAIAFASWLLIAQTSSESEQRVFAIGALLLLGGAAAHLSLSALFAGFLAGLFWNAAGGAARDGIARDLRYLQHPLVVLLLVVAGSRLALSFDLAGIIVAYVVLRIAAKRVGGWIAGRAAQDDSADPGFALSSPGVVGIAIALNVLQAGGGVAAGKTLFAIVVVGSLASELLSLLMLRREKA